MNVLGRGVPFLLSIVMAAQTPVLQIRATEGDGAVYRAGSRVPAPLRIKVTDEIGNPVAGALVSFRLPDDGPTGLFSNGLNTDVTSCGEDGQVSAPAVRWNLVPGTVLIRVTAVKGQSRAGTAVSLRLSDPARASESGAERSGLAQPAPHAVSRPRIRTKWLIIGVAVASGATLGFVSGRARNTGPNAANAPAGVRIGLPSITIGRP